MQKKILASIIVFLIGILVFYACRKNDSVTTKDQEQKSSLSSFENPKYPMKIRLAQRYYNKLVREEGDEVKYLASGQARKDEVNRKQPIWKKAYEGSNDSITFVEVPIVYNRRSTSLIKLQKEVVSQEDEKKLLNGSFDRLLITKNKATGKVAQYIINYLPSLKYLDSHKGDASSNQIGKFESDFSGFLQYRYWDGTPFALHKVEKGRFVRKFKSFNPQNPVSTNSQAREVCLQSETYCNVTWSQTCYNGWVGESYYSDCTDWELTVNYCWEECVSWGDDGSGNEVDTDNCTEFSNNFSQLAGTVESAKESVEQVSNDGTTRKVRYIWKVYTVSGGILFPTYLKSMDSAVIVNNGGLWKYSSLSHIKIFKVGLTPLYDVAIEDVTDTPELLPQGSVPNQIAKMSLHFTVRWHAVCDGSPFTYDDVAATNQSWYVGE